MCNCESFFSFCLQNTKMFLGILLSLSLNLWSCEATQSKCNNLLIEMDLSEDFENPILYITSVLRLLCSFMFHNVANQEKVTFCNIRDTCSNPEAAKLLDKMKFAARSCKEIRDKYRVYDGTIYSIYFCYVKQQLHLFDSGMLLFNQMACTI